MFVQKYLKNGLVDYERVNIRKKEFYAKINEHFLEFIKTRRFNMIAFFLFLSMEHTDAFTKLAETATGKIYYTDNDSSWIGFFESQRGGRRKRGG